jgi:phage major head subunit gpT-like protein
MALNEASLESAIVGVQQFLDVAGLRCMVKPQKLIVPPQLQFTAERILASSFRTGTNNNDLSAIYNITAVPQGYRTNQYLTSSLNWFLTTDASDGFKLFQREDVETDVYTDFSTDNLLCKSTERYSFGVSNFRAGYGVQGV